MSERQRTILAAAVALVALVAGVIAGRACSPPPARVESDTRTDTAAAVVASSDSTRAVERRTERADARPDGRKVTTVVVERVAEGAHVDTTATAATRTVTRTVAVRERPSWRVGVSTGWKPQDFKPRPEVWRADLSRRLVGPVWVGVWAGTDKAAGLSVAAEW